MVKRHMKMTKYIVRKLYQQSMSERRSERRSQFHERKVSAALFFQIMSAKREALNAFPDERKKAQKTFQENQNFFATILHN